MQQPGPGGQGQQPGGPPPDWQAPPPAAPPPGAGAPAGGSWTANITSQAPVAGPGGHVYADVPNRVIAYIIDAIILFVIFLVVNIVLGGILPRATVVADPNNPLGFRVDQPIVTILIFALLNFAITAAYFVYSWTAMRGSPGMKVLGMQIGSERDGSTITINQAFMRFLFLGAPFGIAQALTGISSLGIIIVIATIAYFIFLLVTTAQSPTKQGFHDKQAHTMVVKAARSVA